MAGEDQGRGVEGPDADVPPRDAGTFKGRADHPRDIAQRSDNGHPGGQPLSISVGTMPADSRTSDESRPDGSDQKAGKTKKPEIEDVFGFIEAFYAGRVRGLSDQLRRKLTGTAALLNAEQRGALLRQAAEADAGLDKTRQLLLVSLGLNAYSGLPRTLRDFARVVLALHPAMADRDADAWLPQSGAVGQTPRRLWDDIQAERSTRPPKEATEVDAPEATTVVAAGAPAKKALHNAFMCALIWRHAEHDVRLGETLRDLRATAMAANPGASSLERLALQFVVSLPEREWAGLAALSRWFAEQTTNVQTQLQQASDRIVAQDERIAGLSSELAKAQLERDALGKDLEQAMQRITVLEEQARVSGVHAQADIDALRGRVFRVLEDELPLLRDALVALERDPPRVAPATEYLRTALDKLANAVKIVETK